MRSREDDDLGIDGLGGVAEQSKKGGKVISFLLFLAWTWGMDRKMQSDTVRLLV